MASKFSPRDHRAVIRYRTKLLRERAGKSQAVMAQLLDQEFEAYKKWENRTSSVIPPEYMWRFCQIVGASMNDLAAPPTKDEMAIIAAGSARKTA